MLLLKIVKIMLRRFEYICHNKTKTKATLQRLNSNLQIFVNKLKNFSCDCNKWNDNKNEKSVKPQPLMFLAPPLKSKY